MSSLPNTEWLSQQALECVDRGNLDDARTLMRSAVIIGNALFESSLIDLAETYFQSGFIEHNAGEFAKARHFYNSCETVVYHESFPQNARRADIILRLSNNRAQILWQEKRFEDMESLCCNTLVFANCAGDKVSAEQILQLQLRLTVAKGEQGKLVDAERICNEALALARESVPDHPLTQMLEEELFNIQSRLSILEKINEMLDQIETANREAADADVARQLEADAHSGEGWFKDEIAAIKKLSQHGEFQQAKHDASLILFVARKHGSKNIIAQVLMILAEANFNLGDLEQAKEVYQEAADLYQGSDDPDNPIRSAAQQNLSALDALVSGSKR